MSTFASKAAHVQAKVEGMKSGDPARQNFARVAAEVHRVLAHSPEQRDSEWQRVNSYIADVLKDAHVLYSKLARLQSDFIGPELTELEKIADDVLELGGRLSHFMKAFHAGEANMLKESTFGGQGGGGGDHGGDQGGPGAPPGTPPPAIPSEFDSGPKKEESDYETELDVEGESDFEGYDEAKDKEEE